eukprot:TRINITY_DN22277_c0_g1_i7.p1 TRINITY_DN22277_c0_g1~~TRINITY_DN22277_c0_g1_i7.p1  ORF type:complete len:338 (-),score=69.47 TRINITY_DN22277_c0_g1_i7:495-1508(-)
MKAVLEDLVGGLVDLQQTVEARWQDSLGDKTEQMRAVYASESGFNPSNSFLPQPGSLSNLPLDTLSQAANGAHVEDPAKLLKALYVINGAAADVARVEAVRTLALCRVKCLGLYLEWRTSDFKDPEDVPEIVECCKAVNGNFLSSVVNHLKAAHTAEKQLNAASMDATLFASMYDFCRQSFLTPMIVKVVRWSMKIHSVAAPLIPTGWEAWIVARDTRELMRRVLVDSYLASYKPAADAMAEVTLFLITVEKDCKLMSAALLSPEICSQIASTRTKSQTLSSYASSVVGVMYLVKKWPNASKHAKVGQFNAWTQKNSKDGISVPPSLESWMQERANN